MRAQDDANFELPVDRLCSPLCHCARAAPLLSTGVRPRALPPMALKPSATGKRVANELSATIVDRLDASRDFNRGCAPKFPARGSVKTRPLPPPPPPPPPLSDRCARWCVDPNASLWYSKQRPASPAMRSFLIANHRCDGRLYFWSRIYISRVRRSRNIFSFTRRDLGINFRMSSLFVFKQGRTILAGTLRKILI